MLIYQAVRGGKIGEFGLVAGGGNVVDLVWFQTATCAGDSVSFLNADQPNVFQIVTKLGVNIVFHPTIDPKTGQEAMDILNPYVEGEEKTRCSGSRGSSSTRSGWQWYVLYSWG